MKSTRRTGKIPEYQVDKPEVQVISAFRSALALYDTETFTCMCMHSANIMLPCEPSTDPSSAWAPSAMGHTLFDQILQLENGERKMQFLSAVLEKIAKDSIDTLSESLIGKILEIQEPPIIALLFSKMTDRIIEAILKEALSPEKENMPVWLDGAIVNWKRTPSQNKMLIQTICRSRLDAKEKLQVISTVAKKHIEEIEVEAFLEIEQNIHVMYLHKKLSILHLAIEEGDTDLVCELFKKFPTLIDKPAQGGLTPLLLALLSKKLEILNILLGKRANPNVVVDLKKRSNTHRHKMRRGATQQTLLMIAACLQRADLYQALLDHHADPTIKDNPDDPEAWTAEQYRAQYLPSMT